MRTLTRAEQHAQCMREIRATLLVVLVCAVWHITTAFALNGSGWYFLGMPAWFTVSVLGTIVLGVGGVLLLARFVFVDFEYEPECESGCAPECASGAKEASVFATEASAVDEIAAVDGASAAKAGDR